MYALYRSWLARDALVREPLSMPDVVVSVGEGPGPGGAHQFTAHRAILSANSGYFKAALNTLEPSRSCVSVSGVSAEAFAPLLTFMYTGFLDISGENIYSVLLATHYLHMPRALELCWEFLRTHQPQQQQQVPTLVKPIPSRNKLIGGLPWRPPPHMVLPTAEHSPFRSPGVSAPALPPAAALTPTPEPTLASEPPTPAKSHQPVPAEDSPLVEVTDCHDTADHPGEYQDAGVVEEPAHEPGHHDKRGPSDTQERVLSPLSETDKPTPLAPPQSSSKLIGPGGSGKVVIDVACCDGPVRFHRVLNTSYGSTEADVDDDIADHTDENQLSHTVNVPGAAQLRRARLSKLQHAMESSDTNEYTCLYCNHTFKSHYCYQKHARRHINPLTHKQGAALPAARQPARPLDMNVQYYPCKTCGSKFPSYYFVHKHRKLCHAGDENEPTVAASTEPNT